MSFGWKQICEVVVAEEHPQLIVPTHDEIALGENRAGDPGGLFGYLIALADFHPLLLTSWGSDILLFSKRDEEWRAVFTKIQHSLRLGGSFWVSDLVHHSNPAVQAMMWERYGDYLVQLKGEDYREQVFAYVEQEDSPRPLLFQLDLLREVGFQEIEVLHKNSCFAAFGAIK